MPRWRWRSTIVFFAVGGFGLENVATAVLFERREDELAGPIRQEPLGQFADAIGRPS